jgi:hypothetical protein
MEMAACFDWQSLDWLVEIEFRQLPAFRILSEE